MQILIFIHMDTRDLQLKILYDHSASADDYEQIVDSQYTIFKIFIIFVVSYRFSIMIVHMSTRWISQYF